MRRPLRLLTAAATAVVGGFVPLVAGAPPVAAAEVYTRPSDGVLDLAGHGYGHGHGLSQWGAYGAAMQGVTYDKIIDAYYPSSTWGSTSGQSIRVKLGAASARSADGRYDLEVAPRSGLLASDAKGDRLTLPTDSTYTRWRFVLFADGSIHLQALTSSGWTGDFKPSSPAGATSWSSFARFSAGPGPVTVYPPSGSSRAYRYAVELTATVAGASTAVVVNRLPLDSYLYGVVPAEMPSSWTPNGRLDALEAQAVAARSYAGWRIQHPQSGLFDIYDNTYDQVYDGYSREVTSTNQAVDATAGKIRLDAGGQPIFAQFASSDGGYTADGGEPYLTAHSDPWDGVPTEGWNPHSWTDSITAARIEAAYPSIGRFTSLAITGRESHAGEQWGGRITSLTLNGSNGSTSVSGSSFRGAMGLRSEWFTVVVTKPGAPTKVAATAGDASATVTWAPPTSDGGASITSYTITASPAVTPVKVSASARSAVITGLTNEQAYTFSVAATNSAGTGATAAATPVTPTAVGELHPLPPTRILDTRTNGHPLGPNGTLTLVTSGAGGVPRSGVTAVLLNVTATGSTAASHLTVYPYGVSRPLATQLSWPEGLTTAQLVLAKPRQGAVTIWNYTGSVHIVVDVEGFYGNAGQAGGSRLSTVTPVRLLDTRSDPPSLGPGGTHAVKIAGVAGVPQNATAAVINLTATHPTATTYLTAWPGATGKPHASALNLVRGQTSANEVVVPIGSDGTIVVGNDRGSVEAVVDLQGYYAPASDATTKTGEVGSVLPQRLLDTRTSNGGHDGQLRPGETMTLQVLGRATSVPASATSAVVLSVTATRESAGGYVSVWPAGQPMPTVSNFNPTRATDVGALVTVAPGSNGSVQIHNGTTGTLDLVVDIVGYATS